jgi:hypothetical protein
MADDPTDSQLDDKVQAQTQPPRTLRVIISKCRNLPEGSSTVVSYNYQLKPGEQPEESDSLTGTSEPLDEAAQGKENNYNFSADHILPSIDGAVLKSLITEPFVLNVEGLSAPGKVSIPLTDLVWRPKLTVDDPDEDEFLPEFPGEPRFPQSSFSPVFNSPYLRIGNSPQGPASTDGSRSRRPPTPRTPRRPSRPTPSSSSSSSSPTA